ncbi:MAG: GIY-YIG nuclease family protein [Chthoniobacteraceae bacterium]
MSSLDFARDDMIFVFAPEAVCVTFRSMGGEYFVYMMASTNREALYIGVTNDLARRVWQHRHGEVEGFTSAYHCVDLVYFETCGDVLAAIAREKQLKRWRREKKNGLVERKKSPLAESCGRLVLGNFRLPAPPCHPERSAAESNGPQMVPAHEADSQPKKAPHFPCAEIG